MKKSRFIEIEEVIPDTHFFVYKDKKYPIKFDYFKHASKYFSIHQEEIRYLKNINLLDSEEEHDIAISDDTINDFINFVQHKKIHLNETNAVVLNYLSTKYEVTTLQEITSEYIIEQESEVLLDLLQQHQNDIFFDTSKYELIISKNIKKYINDARLLNIKIPILYRIIKNYFKNENKDDNSEIFEFLFKCLDKYGREASVLFDEVEFGQNKKEYLNRLIQKYSEIFDIQYIKRTIVDIWFENEKEHQQSLSTKNYEIQQLNKEIEELKIKNKNLQECTEQQKLNISNLTRDYEEKIENKNTEIIQMKDKIEQIEKEIKGHQDEKEQLKIELEKQKRDLTKQIDELNNKNEELTKKTKYNNIIELPYNGNNEFNGIIKYLTDRTSGNIHDNGTIEVKTNFHNNSSPPKNLLDFNQGKYYVTNGAQLNAWVCFDFKNMEIEISNYSIKSYPNSKDCTHIKNWVIEISSDGENWKKIDEHTNYSDLNGPSITKTFETTEKHFSRFCRLRHIGKYFGYSSWCMALDSIEFYGRINGAP